MNLFSPREQKSTTNDLLDRPNIKFVFSLFHHLDSSNGIDKQVYSAGNYYDVRYVL